MKFWKIISGIVSLLASVLILSSSIATIVDTNTSTLPQGVFSLLFAGLFLGLAGIIYLVFYNNSTKNVRLTALAFYIASGVLFVVTVIRASFSPGDWVQIIVFILWSFGCALFEYLDMVWSGVLDKRYHSGRNTEKDVVGKNENDSSQVSAVPLLSTANFPPVLSAENVDVHDEEMSVDMSLPPIPQVERESVDTSSPSLTWDGTGAPPRLS